MLRSKKKHVTQLRKQAAPLVEGRSFQTLHRQHESTIQ